MKRSLTVTGLVSAAALALALSACAPAVTTNPPTQGPTSAPTSGPTAKPHHHQAASPAVRVPITCASLFTPAVTSTLVGVPLTSVVDESTTPLDINSIEARQDGELNCLWGGTDKQDGGYVAETEVDVAPDATAGFTANLPDLEAPAFPTIKNTAGDKSEYECTVQGDLSCAGNMLVNGYWVTVYLQDLGAATMSVTAANSHEQQALTTVAAALETATPSPAWNPPGVMSGLCTAAGNAAKINSAVGETDFSLTPEEPQGSDAVAWAGLTGDAALCQFNSANSSEKFTSVSLDFLKGGSWALPALNGAQDPQLYMFGAFSTFTIPGADAAVASCSTSVNQCIVYLTIGKQLVNIELDDPGTAQVTSVLAALVTDIKAS